MQLSKHPIWGGINPLKKRGHLLRFFMAQQYAKRFNRSLFIGITGSVGKTSTTIACKEVLSEKFRVLATTDTLTAVKNLDPVFNLPMTILKIKKGTQKVILEMGIEYPGEMETYLSLVKPATAIVTRISYAHSLFLGGIDEIAKEKGKLVEQLPEDGYAILNYDDLETRRLAARTKAQVVYFGQDKDHAHVWAEKMRIDNFHTIFELNYGVERVEVKSKLLGFHQMYPLLAAATLGLTLDIPLISIKKALEKLEPSEHRMEIVQGYNNSVLIDDTYNSSPAAVEEAIDTLNQISAKRRIAVLGEMRELGQYSDKLHRSIAQKLFKEKVDMVFTGKGDAEIIGDELSKLGFDQEKLFSGLSNPEIAAELLKILSRGDVVLIKASKLVKFDEVVPRVAKQKK